MDSILTQILWRRIIGAVDEAAAGLVRTCYSSVVRDYFDFACAVFDADANMIAHSTKSTAGFIGILPEVMRHFSARFPPETLSPGDVLATNDPWLASGHLPDISCATPIYHGGKLVGYALCVVHHLDIGGRGNTTESRSLYEEGLQLPPLKLYKAHEPNNEVFDIIRTNVRVSERVIGDIRSQVIANFVCARAITKLMDQYGLDDLREIAREVLDRTERSLRAKIAMLPDGVYRNEVLLPPVGAIKHGIPIKVAVIVEGDQMTLDFTGSSGEVEAAVNVTFNKTRSYAVYPIKAALDPEVPNNAGALRAVKVVAPEGTLLNCRRPAPVWGRTVVSHNLPEIVMGALVDLIPDRIIASCGATPGNLTFFSGQRKTGRQFVGISIHYGGYGANSKGDGETGLAFPFNAGNIPVEVSEIDAAILYRRKELITDSGGPGEFRGGVGQVIELVIPDGDLAPDGPVSAGLRGSARGPDSSYPVFGRRGGKPGRGSSLKVNGKSVAQGLLWNLVPGDTVEVSVPGGGGFGEPFRRDPERVLQDVELGFVSEGAAREEYGVVITDGQIDRVATAAARLQGAANP